MWRVTVTCKGGQTGSRGCHSHTSTKLDEELSANYTVTVRYTLWILLCVPLLCHLLGDLRWLVTVTEEHACLSCNSKSYWYDYKNNAVVFSSSESGWPFWSARSPWQVSVDNQRCEAWWLGSLWLWGTQQDRRPSEEHVSGHWVWVYYNPITV